MDRKPILPDPYSLRFGLRSHPIKTIQRPHSFMSWSPPYDLPLPQTSIKTFMICQIYFSPVGFLTLQEAGLLEHGDGQDASILPNIFVNPLGNIGQRPCLLDWV